MLLHSPTSSSRNPNRLPRLGKLMPLKLHFWRTMSRITAAAAKFAVAEQIDHIIEIARASAFAERPNLLAEHFLEGVAACRDAGERRVRVGVRHRAGHWRQDQPFVGGQIKLDAREIAARSDRTA